MPNPQPAVPQQGLPEHLRPLFWDHEFGRLAWPADRDLIVARVLERGGDDGIRWLLHTVGEPDLRNWIVRRSGRGLDARRLRFWQVILDIPEDQVTRWIEAVQAEPWTRRNG
jgi:hypothetical protein